ncbi:acyl-coenzyme A thioesterase 1-like isoform X1 [Esox lucius]|uniref:acyl-coenzyme A thioesterase 1-like isoform X1 n=1 Tax=Esox lucius TaxID=8010 RepID=UPI0009732A82|nr:acyl-coenzyme A thioesterase 1-like isoform X1 [Esox lucius]
MFPNKLLSSTMATISPLLSVKPTRGLVDEKIQIIVRNVPPRFPVTLHSLFHSEDKDYWEAFGHYTSDNRGTVTVSEHASVGGTYEGTEPMGLLWSMHPAPGSRTGLRLRKMNVLTPMVVHISVYSGHVTEGFSKQSPLATVDIERWYLAPGVRRIDIRDEEVKGTLFIPPGTKGPGPFPGVLDLWGGGGGLVEYRSALLASHGFVSMALEYISTEKNRASNLHIKYFEKAFRIVQEHPLVMKDSVALFGLSLGTSITLHMAAYSKAVSPRCCVCVSGSHVQPINSPFKDVSEKFQENRHKIRFDEEGGVIWKDIMLPIPTDPGLKVDMGRIKCPVILIVGEDDQNLAAVESAEDLTQMMRAAGNEHLLTTFRYPGAGHLIEPPYTPHVRASKFMVHQTGEKVTMLWGGYPKPHASAQEDSWEKILRFLQQHLYPSQDSVPKAKL